MLQFYKPNAKNTGSACSIYYSTTNSGFFLQILKQDGWNGKNGLFSNSRKDVAKNVMLKLSNLEAANILLVLEGSVNKMSKYHQFPGARYATTIALEPYVNEKFPGAFSLSVSKKDKQDTTAPAVLFRIGLYAEEARLLREYLILGLREIMLYRPEEKSAANKGASAEAAEPATVAQSDSAGDAPTEGATPSF